MFENAKRARLADRRHSGNRQRDDIRKGVAFGGKAVMTDQKHPSGTDRIAEVAASLKYDIIVNVQGDEPLIRPEMIDDVIALLSDQRASIGTLVKRIENTEEINDPNVVKAVFDREGFALYFSRAPIPSHARHSEIRMPCLSTSISAYTATGGTPFFRLPPC